MRPSLAIVVLMLLSLVPSKSFADPPVGWDLVWHDVFANDNNTLNVSKWGILTGKKLYYDGCWATSPDIQTELFASKVTVGQYLHIETTKKPTPTSSPNVPYCTNPGVKTSVNYNYDSGYVFGKQEFKYGWFEISIRSKRVSGTWPYFLLLGQNICPGNKFTQEMDIYEQFDVSSNLQSTIHGTNPAQCLTEQDAWCDFADCTEGGTELIGCLCNVTPIDIQNNFYVYQLHWTPTTESISFLPEGGSPIGALALNTPDNHHDFVNVHYATYGRNFTTPTPNPSQFPVTMDLKYFKVWKNDLYSGGQFEPLDEAPWITNSLRGPWTKSSFNGGTPELCTGAQPGSSAGLCWMGANGSVGPYHVRSIYSGSAGQGGKVCMPNLPKTPNASYFSDKDHIVVAGDIRTVNAQTEVLVEYETRVGSVWSTTSTYDLNVPTGAAWTPLGPREPLHTDSHNNLALEFNKVASMNQLRICFTFTTAGGGGCASPDGVMDLDNIAVYGEAD